MCQALQYALETKHVYQSYLLEGCNKVTDTPGVLNDKSLIKGIRRLDQIKCRPQPLQVAVVIRRLKP